MVSGLCGEKSRGGGESENERGRKRQGESEVAGVLLCLWGQGRWFDLAGASEAAERGFWPGECVTRVTEIWSADAVRRFP